MCNQAIMFSKRESELLNEICRIIVEVGGYRFAWIGFAENNENKSIRPVAYAGYEGGYLSNLNLTWEDSELGRGPTGTAIRTGKPSIARNILKDPKFKPWRGEAIKRGYISSIALPIVVSGDVIGALNIYSDEENIFEAGEIELLKKIANNLSFGIDALRERAIRRYIEKIRIKQQQRLEALWNIAKLVDADEKTLCDKVMAEVINMTYSKYAFYGFLNEDESVMTIYSWSKDVMEDCQIQNKPVEYPVAKAGIWGDAVRERRTIIVNDLWSSPSHHSDNF
jgi:GAF domain-containing protein